MHNRADGERLNRRKPITRIPRNTIKVLYDSNSPQVIVKKMATKMTEATDVFVSLYEPIIELNALTLDPEKFKRIFYEAMNDLKHLNLPKVDKYLATLDVQSEHYAGLDSVMRIMRKMKEVMLQLERAGTDSINEEIQLVPMVNEYLRKVAPYKAAVKRMEDFQEYMAANNISKDHYEEQLALLDDIRAARAKASAKGDYAEARLYLDYQERLSDKILKLRAALRQYKPIKRLAEDALNLLGPMGKQIMQAMQQARAMNLRAQEVFTSLIVPLKQLTLDLGLAMFNAYRGDPSTAATVAALTDEPLDTKMAVVGYAVNSIPPSTIRLTADYQDELEVAKPQRGDQWRAEQVDRAARKAFAGEQAVGLYIDHVDGVRRHNREALQSFNSHMAAIADRAQQQIAPYGNRHMGWTLTMRDDFFITADFSPTYEISQFPRTGSFTFGVSNYAWRDAFDKFMISAVALSPDMRESMIAGLRYLSELVVENNANRCITVYENVHINGIEKLDNAYNENEPPVASSITQAISAHDMLDIINFAIEQLSDVQPIYSDYMSANIDKDLGSGTLQFGNYDLLYGNPFAFRPLYFIYQLPRAGKLGETKEVMWLEIETLATKDGECIERAFQVNHSNLATVNPAQITAIAANAAKFWTEHVADFSRSSDVRNEMRCQLAEILEPIKAPWFIVNALTEHGTWKVLCHGNIESDGCTGDGENGEQVNRLTYPCEKPDWFLENMKTVVGLMLYKGHLWRIVGMKEYTNLGWEYSYHSPTVRAQPCKQVGLGSKLVRCCIGNDKLRANGLYCFGPATTQKLMELGLCSCKNVEELAGHLLSKRMLKALLEDRELAAIKKGGNSIFSDSFDESEPLDDEEETEPVPQPAELYELLLQEIKDNEERLPVEQKWSKRLKYGLPVLICIKIESGEVRPGIAPCNWKREPLVPYPAKYLDKFFLTKHSESLIIVEEFIKTVSILETDQVKHKPLYARVVDFTGTLDPEGLALENSVRECFNVARRATLRDTILTAFTDEAYEADQLPTEEPREPTEEDDDPEKPLMTIAQAEKAIAVLEKDSTAYAAAFADCETVAVIDGCGWKDGTYHYDFKFKKGKVTREVVDWEESTERMPEDPRVIKLWLDPDGSLWVIYARAWYRCANVVKHLQKLQPYVYGAFDNETRNVHHVSGATLVSYMLRYSQEKVKKDFFDGPECLKQLVSFLEREMNSCRDNFIIFTFSGGTLDLPQILDYLTKYGRFLQHVKDSLNRVGNRILEICWRGRIWFRDLRRFTGQSLYMVCKQMNLFTVKAAANHSLVQRMHEETGYDFKKFKELFSSKPYDYGLLHLDRCTPEFIAAIKEKNGYEAYVHYCVIDTEATLEAAMTLRKVMMTVPEFLKDDPTPWEQLNPNAFYSKEEVIKKLSALHDPDTKCTGPGLAYYIASKAVELFPVTCREVEKQDQLNAEIKRIKIEEQIDKLEDAAGNRGFDSDGSARYRNYISKVQSLERKRDAIKPKHHFFKMPRCGTYKDEQHVRASADGGQSRQFDLEMGIPPIPIEEPHATFDAKSEFPHGAMAGSMPAGMIHHVRCFKDYRDIIQKAVKTIDKDGGVHSDGGQFTRQFLDVPLEERLAYCKRVLGPKFITDVPINKLGCYKVIIIRQPGYVSVPMKVKGYPSNYNYRGSFVRWLDRIRIDLARFCGAEVVILRGHWYTFVISPPSESGPYSSNPFFIGSLFLWRAGKMNQDNMKDMMGKLLASRKAENDRREAAHQPPLPETAPADLEAEKARIRAMGRNERWAYFNQLQREIENDAMQAAIAILKGDYSEAARFIYKLLSNSLLGKYMQRLQEEDVKPVYGYKAIDETITTMHKKGARLVSMHYFTDNEIERVNRKEERLIDQIAKPYNGAAIATFESDPEASFEPDDIYAIRAEAYLRKMLPKADLARIPVELNKINLEKLAAYKRPIGKQVKEAPIAATMHSFSHTHINMALCIDSWKAKALRAIETDAGHLNPVIRELFITQQGHANPYWIDSPIRVMRKQPRVRSSMVWGENVIASYQSEVYFNCGRIGDFRLNHDVSAKIPKMMPVKNKDGATELDENGKPKMAEQLVSTTVAVGAAAWQKVHGGNLTFEPVDYGHFEMEFLPVVCRVYYPMPKFYMYKPVSAPCTIANNNSRSKGVGKLTRVADELARAECSPEYRKLSLEEQHDRSAALFEQAAPLHRLKEGQNDEDDSACCCLDSELFENVGRGVAQNLADWRFQGRLAIGGADRVYYDSKEGVVSQQHPHQPAITHVFSTKLLAPHPFFRLSIKDKTLEPEWLYQSKYSVLPLTTDPTSHTELMTHYKVIPPSVIPKIIDRCLKVSAEHDFFAQRAFTITVGDWVDCEHPGVPRAVCITNAAYRYLVKHSVYLKDLAVLNAEEAKKRAAKAAARGKRRGVGRVSVATVPVAEVCAQPPVLPSPPQQHHREGQGSTSSPKRKQASPAVPGGPRPHSGHATALPYKPVKPGGGAAAH